MDDHREEKPTRESEVAVSMDSAIVAITCASLLYALSWIVGCSTAPAAKAGGGKKITHTAEPAHFSPERQAAPAVSGRKLTIEKMARRAASSLQYGNEEYGVALEAPKGYILKEGELPEMDRGLGYLGPVPMHFAQAGGIRLVTVEPPQGAHPGTNFINAFFTVSALDGNSESACADFNIPAESRGAPVTRTVDTVEFHGFAESSAASMHQYNGVYLHGFANDTCYEIGYGLATIAGEGPDSLKHVAADKVLPQLEGIFTDVRIAPPQFELNQFH